MLCMAESEQDSKLNFDKRISRDIILYLLSIKYNPCSMQFEKRRKNISSIWLRCAHAQYRPKNKEGITIKTGRRGTLAVISDRAESRKERESDEIRLKHQHHRRANRPSFCRRLETMRNESSERLL